MDTIKNIGIALGLLFCFQAQAEHFNCDLDLNVIPDSSSSELKQLVFDVELKTSGKNITEGTMTTVSCFGNFSENFTSDTSKLMKATLGDLTSGMFKDRNLVIGSHRYQLYLKFEQLVKNPDGKAVIDMAATGKLLPLDNDGFIHQDAKGECHLSKERLFSNKFLTMAPERCK